MTVRLNCIGRRRLEVSYLKDTDQFEMKIMQDGGVFPDRYIACPIIPAKEFEKLGVFFEEEQI